MNATGGSIVASWRDGSVLRLGVEHKTRFRPGGATVLHINKPSGESLTGNPMVEPDPGPMLSIMREILLGTTPRLSRSRAGAPELAASIASRSFVRETDWPVWLERVRQRLFDDPAEGLTVREIAEEGAEPVACADVSRANRCHDRSISARASAPGRGRFAAHIKEANRLDRDERGLLRPEPLRAGILSARHNARIT